MKRVIAKSRHSNIWVEDERSVLPRTNNDNINDNDNNNDSNKNDVRTNNDSHKSPAHRNTTAGSSNNTRVKRSRRRSGSRKILLNRVVAGIVLSCLGITYIIATRYVILQSAAVTRRNVLEEGRRNSNDPVIDPTIGSNNHRRVLYQPIIIVWDLVDDDNQQHRKMRAATATAQSVVYPMTVGFYFTAIDPMSYVGTEQLDAERIQRYNDNSRRRIIREEFITRSELKRQKALLDSEDYGNGEADTFEDNGPDCVAQFDWQEPSFQYPTCNHLMETDWTNLHTPPTPLSKTNNNNNNNKKDVEFVPAPDAHSFSHLLAAGYWRDVWRVENVLRKGDGNSDIFILKSIRYNHDYEPRNYDRHRRDAVTMERLSSSPFVMNIYAACGNSGLFEYADGGSLDDSIWYSDDKKPWSSKERLVVAYQAVSGIADMHNIGKEGVPSIAHTDITTQQFVYVNEAGVYKLNDFNRARFLPRNKKTNAICTYKVGNNPGSVRVLVTILVIACMWPTCIYLDSCKCFPDVY